MARKKWGEFEKFDFAQSSLEESVNQRDPVDIIDTDVVINLSLLTRNLFLFIVLKTIGSFDSGAFSGALGAENGIAEEWNLSNVHQGTLGSSVFLGNIFGCILSGNLFSRYSAKNVLVWSLILHSMFTFLFANSTNYNILLFSRFLIGITLSFVVVYTPLWVDKFAPQDRQTVWMASHNAGVPLGIMLGYISGALLPSYTNINWEWAFYIKCIFTVPVILYLIRVDSRSIDQNNNNKNNSGGGGGTSRLFESCLITTSTSLQSLDNRLIRRNFDCLYVNFLYFWRTCILLVYNVEFMSSMLSMCSLYFVVSGLQNFITQYLRNDPFNASMKTILMGFSSAVVIAPVIGVIIGGILLDRIGGYQNNLLRVTLFTCTWGIVAAFLSILCIFITDTIIFLLVISIMLFCGGAIIAPLSGTLVASLPEQLRPAGAAFAQMMFNLLGNFSGPIICGLIAEWSGKLKYGIYTIFLCAVIGLVPMFVLLWQACFVARQPHSSSLLGGGRVMVGITEEEENEEGGNGGGGGGGNAVEEEKTKIITTTIPITLAVEISNNNNNNTNSGTFVFC